MTFQKTRSAQHWPASRRELFKKLYQHYSVDDMALIFHISKGTVYKLAKETKAENFHYKYPTTTRGRRMEVTDEFRALVWKAVRAVGSQFELERRTGIARNTIHRVCNLAKSMTSCKYYELKSKCEDIIKTSAS